ncbi:MAG: YcaO-related McrA-glycine thioamidation protein [Candidatus Methanofastidiosia archaeon]
MELLRRRKRYMDDTHRIKKPQETLDAIKDKMSLIGVTRTADITKLDRVGVPVFSSIRPKAMAGAVSVYNGKGVTKTEAKVSAMMEAVERYSAEVQDGRLEFLSESELSVNHISPLSLILPNPFLYDTSSRIGWICGEELNSGDEVYVPGNAVFHPYPAKYFWLFRTSTNGLASGNCIEEAILHGLCEVIERDAWSIYEISRKIPPDVEVDIKSDILDKLLKAFEKAGVEITIKDITSDIGIPTFVAVADDIRLKDPALLNMGMGSHLSPKIALIRALTEVAQSRLTQIHGAREDTISSEVKKKIGYERMKRLNRQWFSRGEKILFSDIPSLDTKYIKDDIGVVLERLSRRGLSQVIVVDLTREKVDVPVVRIVVPGLEQFALDRDRVGMRGRKAA